MAITKSAKKALRSSLRKRLYNTRRSRSMKDAITQVKDLIKAGNKAEAQKLMPLAQKAIDKALKGKTIVKNAAARKKARLAAAIKKLA
jgi:small subunit ribosomal protein S20